MEQSIGWLLSALISALLQVVLLSAIPVLVHRIWFRKREPLRRFLGLYAPQPRTVLLGLGVAGVVLVLFIALGSALGSDLLRAPNAVAMRFKSVEPPLVAVIGMLLAACVQTSLSEEIFFRGFVARRLIAALGATLGNALQALFFGAIHVALIFGLVSHIPLWQALVYGLLVALGGAGLGYVTEVKGNGSIVPAWIAHAALNLASYLYVRFF
jgi:membrane protease YdiL (CAAX protease family)